VTPEEIEARFIREAFRQARRRERKRFWHRLLWRTRRDNPELAKHITSAYGESR
jgi:hypothetical protein